jgi:hypothetical protein
MESLIGIEIGVKTTEFAASCSLGNGLILKRPGWFAAPVRDNTEVGYRGITRRFGCGF